MDCREFLLRYSDYDDSLIPPDEAARFRAHMAECASCARYDRVLRKGRMLARQLPAPEPDPDFIPRLRLRLQEAGYRRRSLNTAARMAMGLAAATILMVASTAVLLDGVGPTTEAGASASAWEAAAAKGLAASSADDTGASPHRARVVVLPPVDRIEPRAWPVRKVAPAPAASYSPLETGPPVYRVASSSSTPTTTRALD